MQPAYQDRDGLFNTGPLNSVGEGTSQEVEPPRPVCGCTDTRRKKAMLVSGGFKAASLDRASKREIWTVLAVERKHEFDDHTGPGWRAGALQRQWWRRLGAE